MNSTSPFLIRTAVADDQAAIRRLVREGGINPFGLHWTRFQVAVLPDGMLIGCGQVKPHRDGSRELASIAVTSAWQRQGVAAAIINRLQKLHPPPLWLTCLNTLVPIYARFGFAEIEQPDLLPRYYRRARQFMRVFFWIRHDSHYLAVMRWPAT